jgi:hypothetical protein
MSRPWSNPSSTIAWPNFMQDFSEQIADGGHFEYPFKDRIDARWVSLFRMITIKLWALALRAPYLFAVPSFLCEVWV